MRLDPTPFLNAAVERGLLTSPVALRELAGNVDRRPDLPRHHWYARDAQGIELKLTVGRALAAVRERADQFHAALPHHSPATRFFFHAGEYDVWAQEWLPGESLESEADTLDGAIKSVLALESLEHALASTSRASTPAAGKAEFDTWCETALGLPIWNPAEKGFLKSRLLPAVATGLLREPRLRWSNGDFTSANIKCGRSHAALIDFEHGGLTHFYAEDRVRFLRLSGIAQRHPGLFSGLWPEPTPPWEIYFQLRQLSLEIATNTEAYLRRVIPERKAYLRSSFETMGLREDQWAEPARLPPPVFAEETAQLFWRGPAQAWTEARSQRLCLRQGAKQFAAFRLPPQSNATELRFDPTATSRASTLHSLRLVRDDGTSEERRDQPTVAGAALETRPDGIRIVPDGTDPQLFFSAAQNTRFLFVEISVS